MLKTMEKTSDMLQRRKAEGSPFTMEGERSISNGTPFASMKAYGISSKSHSFVLDNPPIQEKHRLDLENLTLYTPPFKTFQLFLFPNIFASFNDTFIHVTNLSGRETLVRITDISGNNTIRPYFHNLVNLQVQFLSLDPISGTSTFEFSSFLKLDFRAYYKAEALSKQALVDQLWV
ncbi:hypothetical protein J5N97_024159 [Dioscorea zingiberensis]|uniref:Uncharacterized protein n=1 Tax=Dioscorea zingiberensis TaxID=325984 RepID=A0A9D5C776_9LILI|nr:hypothetical protein J5N97_024159 [Dioscorea zingiberensis]